MFESHVEPIWARLNDFIFAIAGEKSAIQHKLQIQVWGLEDNFVPFFERAKSFTDCAGGLIQFQVVDRIPEHLPLLDGPIEERFNRGHVGIDGHHFDTLHLQVVPFLNLGGFDVEQLGESEVFPEHEQHRIFCFPAVFGPNAVFHLVVREFVQFRLEPIRGI
jgi:hypothetical protein